MSNTNMKSLNIIILMLATGSTCFQLILSSMDLQVSLCRLNSKVLSACLLSIYFKGHYIILMVCTNTVISVANIDISIPLNTGVVGGRISHVQIRLPVDILFEDFFSHICAKMDLDPAGAELGYKFHNNQVQDAPHQLSNEQQLWEAFEQGCDLIK
ncbi:uncharacterized protein F5891DRAFT_980974 [Suillus fuscotomentosus]|uniref:Uncharacterized protein n=1 Tax=Suillus fuscotomentosus TaxID=1912939 RepID=A0AAD4E7H4_9AGAM|nr:uncharacterized protein F5891DRAFT_980974 [Suillus fuscotomentosus]KAG1899748.1 hypothetical protein F5891DRAFT_980974 [Suillus fuscotomentosus]